MLVSGFVRVRGETDASLVEFAAVCDDDLGFGRAALCAMLLYRLDDVDALHDFAEHDVLPVQPGEDKENLLDKTSRVSLYDFFNRPKNEKCLYIYRTCISRSTFYLTKIEVAVEQNF